MTPIFFNLLVNSTFSLLCGLMVVGFAIWLFKVQTDGWKVFLMSLPFVKVIYDLILGVSNQSILYTNINPLLLPPKSQTFQIGMGITYWHPYIQGIFQAKDSFGNTFRTSPGDYLMYWISGRIGLQAPKIILLLLLLISGVFILVRLYHAMRFEQLRKGERKQISGLEVRFSGLRKVDLYISSKFSGTPFTGGILKPYICLPNNAVSKLTPQELDAVIAHELGHVRNFDLLTTFIIQLLGDVLWFVPGYRWLSRRIDRLREITADDAAVKSGVTPEHLASALVKLREIPNHDSKMILYSAFFRNSPLLKERVQRLLGERSDSNPRLGWQHKWVRIVASIVIGGAVLSSVFGGNYNFALGKNPEWFVKAMKKLEAKGINNLEK